MSAVSPPTSAVADRPGPPHLALGFVTNFFDALGIGSYATTTAGFKAWGLVPDEVIPGTLNIGHAIPTVVEAAIYISAIQVEARTLMLLIGTSVLGAWIGAGMVAGWGRRRVQRGMAVALMVTVTFMLLRMTGVFPGGGDALGLAGLALLVAMAGNFLLGALMTLGIGLYAPCMGMVSLLGMSPKTAFPIMMGSCACLMPVASVRFFRAGRYDRRAALGLTLGGVPAILIAAFAVKALPLDTVRVLVIGVITYTAARMWRDSGVDS